MGDRGDRRQFRCWSTSITTSATAVTATCHYVDGASPATGANHRRVSRLPRDCRSIAAIAEDLYTAISTDTGSFQYSSTTPATYRWAARTWSRPASKSGELNRRIYQSHPLRRISLLGELFNVLEMSAEGRCASWILTGRCATGRGPARGHREHDRSHPRH